MAAKHAFFVAIVLGFAAGVGAVAAIKTASLGQPQAKASTAKSQTVVLLKRSRLLDRQEIALRKALAKRPPKLPKVPKFAPAAAPAPVAVSAASARAAVPAVAPTVRYVHPAPVIVVKHRPHRDDGGAEQDHPSGGGDD